MESMAHEILVEICRRLPFEERYNTVSLVSKALYSAARDPACWESLDMEECFDKYRVVSASKLNQMVVNAVDWSRGSMAKLQLLQCDSDTVLYAATRCPQLCSLSISLSPLVSDEAAATLVLNCPRLEYVHVSGCRKISVEFLKALGSNCRSLTTLEKNVAYVDEEASLIGSLLPGLKHLELQMLSDRGLELIAAGCRDLEYLDLSHCNGLTPAALDAAAGKLPKLRYLGRPMNYAETRRYGHWQLYSNRD